MSEKLLVNPIDCEGHGACAELLPEMINLDEWGYPIVDPRPVPAAWSATPARPSTPARPWRSACCARNALREPPG